MKKVLLFAAILTFFPTVRCQAQSGGYESYMKTAGDYAALYRGRVEPVFFYTGYLHHPFLFEKNFTPGSISINGIYYPNVNLRYDVFRNYLAVVANERQIPVLPEQDKIDFFVYHDKVYVPFDGWFVCLEHYGKHLSFMHKTRKLQGNDEVIGKFVYKPLEVKENYYLCDADGNVTPISSVRLLNKMYPQYKKQLKEFIKEEELKFSKPSLNNSLALCVAKIDALLTADKGSVEAKSLLSFRASSAPEEAKQQGGGNVPTVEFEDPEIITSMPSYDAFKIDGKADYTAMAEDDNYADNPVAKDLEPYAEARSLEEVQVVGFRQKLTMEQSGMEAFRPALLKNIPLVMGEADVLKMALMLPGIQSTGEASSGLNVRGGATDQNLVLLNNGTVFNCMHLFGVFSSFNSDLISEAQIYKGGIPAQFGGRLSSVMDIKGKYADMAKFHGSASIGLLTSKGTFELPIVKDKVSLLVSGRTTYSDWLLKQIPEKSGYKNGKGGFYDLGGVLTAKLSSKHRLNIYGYYSADRFSFTQNDNYKYRNANGSLEWKGIYSDSLFSNFAVGYDHYDYLNEEDLDLSTAGRLTFNINQFWAKGSMKYILNDKHTLSFGLNSTLSTIMPGEYGPVGEASAITKRTLQDDKALESAVYAEDVWSLTDKLSVTGGVRLNIFNSMKEDSKHTYFSPELRLSGTYKLNDESSVKLGFNNTNQYIHKVSNTVIMCPTDTWIYSNSHIKPQNGIQVSMGYYYNWKDYEFSVEAYWKRMGNLLTYRSGAQILMNENLWKDVMPAKGRAYGIELQVHKQYGKLTGWISYCYSRSQMRQNDPGVGIVLNDGEWFNADYDSPHAFKFSGNYKFTRRVSLSLTLDYSTGRPLTVPAGEYYNYQYGKNVPYYDKRNMARMPFYFRSDASLNIEPSHHLTALTHSWFSIGVYNMLGRRNAYSIYFVPESGELKSYRLSIYGAPIPFVSYNIKF